MKKITRMGNLFRLLFIVLAPLPRWVAIFEKKIQVGEAFQLGTLYYFLSFARSKEAMCIISSK